MKYLSDSIKRLIDHFDALPGIGPKNAARLAFHILQRKETAKQFAADLQTAADSATFCRRCQNLSDKEICPLCRDTNRNARQICVVAQGHDIDALEHTGKYRGLYHVLHGTINPLEGITPAELKVKELLERLEADNVTEVILALDVTMEGEATSMYLGKLLKDKNVKVSKLARGLPMGSNIEYADEVTLSQALENRQQL